MLPSMNPTNTALVSASIAVISACIAAYTTRGNSARAGFELARSLVSNLTSADTAKSRGILERYRRGTGPTNETPDMVLDHYFNLLWQFEQIHAGRQSLNQQRRINGTRPAVRYLDAMTSWHISEWAHRWLEIRTQLDADRGESIDDEHSLDTFNQLLASIHPKHWRLPSLEAVVNAQRLQREEREQRERREWEGQLRRQATTTLLPNRTGTP